MRPAELARDFPGHHNTGNARGYSLTCYALAGLVLLSAVIPGVITGAGRGDATIPCGAVLAGFLVALLATICEVVIALILAWLAPPTCAPRPYHFWRGLTHATSGFLVITCAVVTVTMFLTIALAAAYDIGKALLPPTWIVSAGVLLAIFVWWSLALMAIVRCRARPGLGRSVALCAIPLVGLGTIVLGFVLMAIVPTLF